MEIVILPDNAAIGRLGADAVGNLLQRKPAAVLGLATGSSPLSIYDELATRSAECAEMLDRLLKVRSNIEQESGGPGKIAFS